MKLPRRIKGWLSAESTPEQLLERYYTKGDRSALARVVECYNRDVFHYLLSLSDEELAKDVLQMTWLKVINHKGSHQFTHAKSWLFSIARRSLIDELRKTKHFVDITEDTHAFHSQTLQSELELADRVKLFNDALLKLNFFQREAIIFQQEGFSLTEIAQLTDESFETVKSRLRYGKNHLKILLGHNDE